MSGVGVNKSTIPQFAGKLDARQAHVLRSGTAQARGSCPLIHIAMFRQDWQLQPFDFCFFISDDFRFISATTLSRAAEIAGRCAVEELPCALNSGATG
jgi:hypothetical protein